MLIASKFQMVKKCFIYISYVICVFVCVAINVLSFCSSARLLLFCVPNSFLVPLIIYGRLAAWQQLYCY